MTAREIEDSMISEVIDLWAADVARASIAGITEATLARLIAKAYLDGRRSTDNACDPSEKKP